MPVSIRNLSMKSELRIALVMAASRSLIVDTLPIAKQQSGSAWGKSLKTLSRQILRISSQQAG